MITHSEFEQALKASKSLDQLKLVLTDYLDNLNFTMYAFTYYQYQPTTQHKLKYEFSSKSYQRWHEHYIAEGYEDIDSTLDSVRRDTLPTLWDIKKQLENAKSERERNMRLDSIEFGIEKGLSIPIHGPFEDFAILVVSQKKGEHCLEKWRELKYNLFIRAYLFYHYIEKHFITHASPNDRY